MTAKELRKEIDTDIEDVIVNRHPGATSREIGHYSQLPLNDIRPSKVIIFAGSNDISRDKTINEFEVVERIMTIGRNAKSVGATVFISSLLIRVGYEYQNMIKRINVLLERFCGEEGFNFINHSDIATAHIGYDGLHVNKYGRSILKMNLLCCFTSFNPYLCNFIQFFEECLDLS